MARLAAICEDFDEYAGFDDTDEFEEEDPYAIYDEISNYSSIVSAFGRLHKFTLHGDNYRVDLPNNIVTKNGAEIAVPKDEVPFEEFAAWDNATPTWKELVSDLFNIFLQDNYYI